MMLELTSNEARILAHEVSRRLADLDREVAHTERRELRAKLAAQRDVVDRLQRRLDRLVLLEARAE
jgi:hypothetical protein